MKVRHLLLLALTASCSGQIGSPSVSGDAGWRTYYVAPTGSDSNPGTLPRPFQTIQHALDVAVVPGDRIEVRSGTYDAGLTFRASGTREKPIVLQNYPGERPFISGKRGGAQKLVEIFNRSHVRVSGFEVGDLVATTPAQSGAIFVDGFGDDVQITNNYVHDVRPALHKYANGRAIQVRGYDRTHALTNVLVSGNVIERCTVQDGNVLEISGNTAHDRVLHNRLSDNSGIALNVTGGTHPPVYTRWGLQVRDVLVSGNQVDSSRGSGAIGLYVQASSLVVVRGNRVTHNAWGLYVTSEYPGVHSRNVTIAGNFISDNTEAGLLVGSPFFPTTVLDAIVERNVVVHNGAFESGNGGNFGIGRARRVTVRGNAFVASDDNALTYLGAPYQDVSLNENCYDDYNHDAATALFGYAGQSYKGFSRYRSATGQDGSSVFGNCTVR